MLNACNNGMSMLVITEPFTVETQPLIGSTDSTMPTEQLNNEKQFGGEKKQKTLSV